MIHGLALEDAPACLLDGQGVFLFVNEAWDRHAEERGWGAERTGAALIGARWVDALACPEVRDRQARLIALSTRPGVRHRPRVLVSEWNTPTTAQLVSTRFEPVMLHEGEPLGIKIVQSVARERPIEEVYELVRRPIDDYLQRDGTVAACVCCGRLQDPEQADRWDLVPDLIRTPLSHPALCELCAELHCVDPDGCG